MSTVLVTQKFQKCIDLCNDCSQVCEECLTACLKEADIQARVKCIEILHDCADICAFSARFMYRNSTYAKQICELCAQICEACATECEMFQDPHCQKCAQICRECALECRNMLNM